MMFPHTITLYNKHMLDGTEKWRRTVLQGVLWTGVQGAVRRKTGAESLDSVTIYIPRLPGYQPPNSGGPGWTLRAGDRMVLGVCDQEIGRSAKELGNALLITTVDDRDFGGDMAHWEVSAK